MSHPAKSIREDKTVNPWKYCRVKECLWRVHHLDGRVTPCQKHKDIAPHPKPENAA